MSAAIIRNGRVIDPANKRDEVVDLAIADGKIAKSAPKDAEVIDAKGLIVAPGWTAIHGLLRDRGSGHKETMPWGARAPAAAGFTPLVSMPNTPPAPANPPTSA